MLDNAIEELSSLPGVGYKTALRYALDFLKKDEKSVKRFADSIYRLKTDIRFCKECHNICDGDLCDICADGRRDRKTICVVENVKDIIAIERTGQYKGIYHILGGVISPMDGIAPADLNIEKLISRVREGGIRELIFALSATIEGDSTAFYISKKLADCEQLNITTIAKGIAVGYELDNIDELTLGRSILNRISL